ALELDGLRHHRGGGETAGLDQLDEAREVAPYLGRAVLAAFHGLLLVEDAERGQRELRVEARHADDDHLAAAAHEVVGGQDGLREPDHLEAVVGAPPARPTPPQPRTAPVEPGLTFAVLSAAPTPVVTPHPMSASCASGRSVSTFTTDASSTVITSANVPRPVMQKYGLPSGRVPRTCIETSASRSQSSVCSRRQCQQAPHAGTKDAMTRSPFFTRD